MLNTLLSWSKITTVLEVEYFLLLSCWQYVNRCRLMAQANVIRLLLLLT